MSSLEISELAAGGSSPLTVELLDPEQMSTVDGGYIPVAPLVWIIVGGAGGFVVGAVAGAAVYYYQHR